MGRVAIVMVQSLLSQLGLRVRQPSVKPVREQFYISLEITQPSTILAPVSTPGSNRSPWVISMGWVHIEAADGTRSKVDKTFGYVSNDNGT